ncbi:MAG: hypothetical protein ACT4O3_09160 [Elusimicrobiota bacterium]
MSRPPSRLFLILGLELVFVAGAAALAWAAWVFFRPAPGPFFWPAAVGGIAALGLGLAAWAALWIRAVKPLLTREEVLDCATRPRVPLVSAALEKIFHAAYGK